MARDAGLEEMVREQLEGVRGLTERAMFGGLAWMLEGRLLCAAGTKGVMVRLGKGNDEEAIRQEGVARVSMGKRVMKGWVRMTPAVFGDGVTGPRLMGRAMEFVRGLEG